MGFAEQKLYDTWKAFGCTCPKYMLVGVLCILRVHGVMECQVCDHFIGGLAAGRAALWIPDGGGEPLQLPSSSTLLGRKLYAALCHPLSCWNSLTPMGWPMSMILQGLDYTDRDRRGD